MFSRMIEIDNLGRPRKVLRGDAPDPFSPVSQEDDLLRPQEATPYRLRVNAGTKGLRCLDGPHIGGGFLIPYRVPLLVHLRLGKYTPSLASRVLGLPVSSLPLRPSVSRGTTGTPLASIATYSLGIVSSPKKGTTLPP